MSTKKSIIQWYMGNLCIHALACLYLFHTLRCVLDFPSGIKAQLSMVVTYLLICPVLPPSLPHFITPPLVFSEITCKVYFLLSKPHSGSASEGTETETAGAKICLWKQGFNRYSGTQSFISQMAIKETIAGDEMVITHNVVKHPNYWGSHEWWIGIDTDKHWLGQYL